MIFFRQDVSRAVLCGPTVRFSHTHTDSATLPEIVCFPSFERKCRRRCGRTWLDIKVMTARFQSRLSAPITARQYVRREETQNVRIPFVSVQETCGGSSCGARGWVEPSLCLGFWSLTTPSFETGLRLLLCWDREQPRERCRESNWWSTRESTFT